MPRENDMEGVQDQGGKHGGQKGTPKPEPCPACGNDLGIVRDERGQEQPRDKARARQAPPSQQRGNHVHRLMTTRSLRTGVGKVRIETGSGEGR